MVISVIMVITIVIGRCNKNNAKIRSSYKVRSEPDKARSKPSAKVRSEPSDAMLKQMKEFDDAQTGIAVPYVHEVGRDSFLEVLVELQEMLAELSISWRLIYGSALGAHRDGNFIMYDDDIDVAISHRDLMRLGKTVESQRKQVNSIAKKYGFVRRIWSDGTSLNPSTKTKDGKEMPLAYQMRHYLKGLNIDLSILYEDDDKHVIFTSRGKAYLYPLEEPVYVTLAGKTFPSYSTRLLEKYYGPKWRTPIPREHPDYYEAEPDQIKLREEWFIPKK